MRKKSKKAINYSRRRAARTRNAGAADEQGMDSDDLSWINDEVDKYNNDRNEVDLKIYDAEESSESEEEVLPIRLSSDEGEPVDETSENDEDVQNSSSEDDENSEGVEVDHSSDEDKDRPDSEEGSSDAALGSDIDDSEDDGLPDANAWGQKRSAFYNADYAGDEHAGFGSSDEEPAELEEKEAISLQRSLNEWISGWEDTRKEKKAESSLKEDAVFHVPLDLSAMSSEQKFRILEQRAPELVKYIEEYKEKAGIMEHYVQFYQLVEKRADKQAIFELARGIFEIIGSYLLNLGFYILMKAKQRDMQGHPVIDRIAQWKEVLDTAFNKWPSFEKDIKSFIEAVKASKRLPEPWSSSLHFSVANLQSSSKLSVDGSDSSEESQEQDHDEFMETTELGKRSITYEMKKNKGLMPKRKKEQRNPRVKHRNRYRKALKKLRSKRPDVKKEMQRYSGEPRGINPYVVRSEDFFPLIRDGNALLVNSLRQKVVRLERLLRDKEDENHKLKSNIRSTKLQEAKIEIETLYQEVAVELVHFRYINNINQLNQMGAQLETYVTELEAKNVKPESVDEILSPIQFSPRPSEQSQHTNASPEKSDEGGGLHELNEAGVSQMKIEDVNALIKMQAAKLIEEALGAHLARVKYVELLCDKHFDIESTSLIDAESTDHQTRFQNLPDLNISIMEDIISDDDSVKIRALDSSPSLAEKLSACSDDEVIMDKREPTSII
ncbi:something about silencing protein 10 [Trichuris trichiura]|uniref:Something about silencing protein 10 n=1 Tax=Trichuris trichiura TaxID=36087 RepID=A0A077ZE28_TRITR|nr:something about silencing protein 10 [Trichuris trichiura]